MALNTGLIDMPAWMKPPETPESTSFLRAYETAQQQNSPLYHAQVQHLQNLAQHNAFEMQKGALDVQKQRFMMEDMLAGRKQESELAGVMSQINDWSDPGSLASLDALYAKRPTAAGRKMLEEAHTRHKEAVTANDRAERNALAADIATSRMQNEAEKNVIGAALAESRMQTESFRQKGIQARHDATIAERQADRLRKERASSARLQIMTETAMEKDKLLTDLKDQLAGAQADMNRFKTESPTLIGKTGLLGRTKDVIAGDFKAAQQTVADLQKQIAVRESQLRKRMSTLNASDDQLGEPATDEPAAQETPDPAGIRSLLSP